MIKGRKFGFETVENGIVVEYQDCGPRKRVFYQFDDFVQWAAEYAGEKLHGRWEPRDPEVSRR